MRAGNVVFRPVDERPQRPAHARELAGEHALLQRVEMRLPSVTGEQPGAAPLDCGNATHCLRVARRQPVPNAPDILPALEACAVEERVLEIIGMVDRPTVADMNHVARFKPFIMADRGAGIVRPIAPAHVVPGQLGLPVQLALGLESEDVAALVRCRAILLRYAGNRVAVHAVGAHFLKGAGNRCPKRHPLVTRSRVPRHDREQHLHSAAVEIRHHLPDARQAARQRAHHVVLIAGIDADVAINRPHQHAVDAAIAPFQIIQVTIHSVFTGHWIVEIAVLHHHLRLNETALRPLERGPIILGARVMHFAQPLLPPMAHRVEPCGRLLFGWRPQEDLAVRLDRRHLGPDGTGQQQTCQQEE